MKSAITQSKKNVARVHLRNTTTSNKTVRLIHMPTREEALRMFIRFLRNHNDLTKHVVAIKQELMSLDNIAYTAKHREVLYWQFWKVTDALKFSLSSCNVDKPHFTDDAIHLFDTLSDTWRG